MRKFGLTLAAALLSASAMGAGSAYADIEVATAGPMTGDYAAFGMQMQRGAEAAVEEINASGGLRGEQIHLHVGAAACVPMQAPALTSTYVSMGVVFVAGQIGRASC